MTHIHLLYFDAGSGHRTAAQAVAHALEGLDQQPYQVRTTNLLDLLADQPLLHAIGKYGIQFANWNLRKESILPASWQVKAFQWVQGRVPNALLKRTHSFWHRHPPVLVLSLMPIANPFVWRSLKSAYPGCPLWILPVDFTEGGPRYWFTPEIPARYLLPTQGLHHQAQRAGIQPEAIAPLDGMPIHPYFYQSSLLDKDAELQQLGLDPSLPTLLVHFGGQGSTFVTQIAAQLNKLNGRFNAIFLCGRSTQFYQQLQHMKSNFPRLVLPFQAEIPVKFYQLADFVIGKPGAMTLTEAMISGKPLIALKSKNLAFVQRGNEDWIRNRQVGEVVEIKDLAAAVERAFLHRGWQEQIEPHRHQGIFTLRNLIMSYLRKDLSTPYTP